MPAELLEIGPLGINRVPHEPLHNGLERESTAQLSTDVMTAVDRNGDKADLNNHHPITVLAKPFASVPC